MNTVTLHELQLVTHIQADLNTCTTLKLFGLIDGVTPGPLLVPFFALQAEAEYQPLFLGTEYEACLPASPYLIAPPTASSDFMQQWGSLSEHQAIWFLSEHDLEQQWRYWRSLVQAITPEQKTAVFRFWHGATLSPYLNACTLQQRRELMAPCRYVYAPQSKRQWQRFDCGTQNNFDPDTDWTMPWWQIKPEHLQPFQSAFDRVLASEIQDQLWSAVPESMAQLYPVLIPDIVNTGIKTARTLGLNGDAAIAAFVKYQIRFGSQFWQNKKLSSLFGNCPVSEPAFMAWVNGLDNTTPANALTDTPAA